MGEMPARPCKMTESDSMPCFESFIQQIPFLLAHRRTIRYQSHPFGRLWRNWQTRYVEVVVGDNPVKVRILLAAPCIWLSPDNEDKHSG